VIHFSTIKIDSIALIICEEDPSRESTLVGFAEIGMLPSPIEEETPGEWGGVETTVKSRREVPYVGNLAVSESYRRQGVASKLIRVGMKVAEKWGEESLFVAVDADNFNAVRLYGKIGFDLVLDESMDINRSWKKNPRLFFEKAL
jgi:ribosomal protein S18 acetylase RimI-like enzyme